MSVLVDYNNVFMAAVAEADGFKEELNGNLVRHNVLNVVRVIRKRHGATYGGVVVCADGGPSWRRNKFPHYKANRRDGRDDSDRDWESIFGLQRDLLDEMREIFPYPVVRVPGAEGDDVIAVLSRGHGVIPGERGLIYSSDHDFAQCVSHETDWWNWRKNVLFTMNDTDPDEELFLHVMRGDVGDGVPNVLSPIDTFVRDGVRQRPLTTKRIETIRRGDAATLSTDEVDVLDRIVENGVLINLEMIPREVVSSINKAYDDELARPRSRRGVLQYMMDHGLSRLTENITDF